MTEITSLVAKRGVYKAQLTRFATFISSFGDESSIVQLNKRLEKIENCIYPEFCDIQMEIEMLDDSDDQTNERTEFENTYFELVSKATEMIKVSENANQNSANSSVSSNVSANNPTSQLSCVKLPTIKLPTFQGAFDTWLEFYDTFDSLINKNSQINNIQKFHYLKSCVAGEASRVIGALETSAANFDIAWGLLCDRYNNKKLLIHNHIKALFNLPSVTKESSVQLRNLIDNLTKNLRSLEQLEQSVDEWDPLLIYMISERLDSATIREWEEQAYKSEETPTLKTLCTFLKNKANLLETIEIDKCSTSTSNHNKFHPRNKGEIKQRSLFASKYACSLCKQSHRIFKCPEFQNLSIASRIDHVQKSKLCMNCLNFGHTVDNCRFGACKRCSVKHNSLLHTDENVPVRGVENNSNSTPNTSVTLTSYVSVTSHTLLSTAIVHVQDKYGKEHQCRVLLDNASESSFITEKLCNHLGLRKTNVKISIIGIGQVSSTIKHKCEVNIQATHAGFLTKLSCLVISEICDHMPTHHIDPSTLNIPSNIHLADPHFNTPSAIDMLIGADLFWSLVCVGQIKLGQGMPILQKTRLGWIISGPIGTFSNSRVSHCNFTRSSLIQDQLERFWQVQEMDYAPRTLSKEETDFENHFVSTFKRHCDGKFIVSIPFKDGIDLLGSSEEYAKRRFLSLERKLQTNSDMREKYVTFINEYIELNHMSRVPEGTSKGIVNFFPHHGVLKEESLTTKLRVVFDGSCPTSSGISINQIQMAGATIQDDIFSIILRFRQFSFVVSSDIEKMYRCVWVTPEQRSLQQIYWRETPSEPLQAFQLNTVTYGTTSASFLAIRCLHQLAIESSDAFPSASKAIKHSFYVDDFLHGADSEDELSKVSSEVTNILQKAGFILRKWNSNNSNIIRGISDSETSTELLKLGQIENSKTLGIFWSSNSDLLCYKIVPPDMNKSSTKRSILSGIAQIYDPLGLLSPCIISIKILLQRLWAEKMKWDESVPMEIHSQWIKFRKEISQLNSLQIPRHIRFRNNIRTELHCFCDASKDGYAASIYVRSASEHGEIMSQLLCAKSKVAPLKVLTIPRLELQGALILARLASKVITSIYIEFDEIAYWCDSTIVLGWIRTAPNLLKTFVANRVCEIQSKTDISRWRHISSGDNPADLASRGVSPSMLVTCKLWWHGPAWISKGSENWPIPVFTLSEELPELKLSVTTLVSQNTTFKFPFQRYSNYHRLIRNVAYCFRFANNCKKGGSPKIDPLTVEEIDQATLAIIRLIQHEHFPIEDSMLSRGKTLHVKSPLLSLAPFLAEGIIRVGGRLSNSDFEYDKRHPILLPKNHEFVKLLFRSEHKRLGHAGPTQLLSTVRNKFWPISGKNAAKQIVHSCTKCFHMKPSSISPMMGDLPSSRVTPSAPFSITGVDYAGPFTLKDKRGRGCKYIKGYVSLFICFSTKAIHLELVTELTAECFIAAFRRFISRRGKPQRMMSDNGTNFVGAKNNLDELGHFIISQKDKIVEASALEGIDWTFIPPYSPHFGGLWESGVKSMKFHLKRIMGNASLTYEDFSTILVQVEGILNSRPLSPLSSNPNDLAPLTPAHFLIGRPITSIPDPDLREIRQSRLSNFQFMQQRVQHFWSKWSSEYINELQCRKKWKVKRACLPVGALVLIKEFNQPPLCWALGRVQEIFPGKDGVSRVASVRTVKGTIRRAVTNLCPLPLEDCN